MFAYTGKMSPTRSSIIRPGEINNSESCLKENRNFCGKIFKKNLKIVEGELVSMLLRETEVVFLISYLWTLLLSRE
jgi:hypothetical protein